MPTSCTLEAFAASPSNVQELFSFVYISNEEYTINTTHSRRSAVLGNETASCPRKPTLREEI
jgi:hypothetical protein